VGSAATSDGSILVARNEDGGSGTAAVRFMYHPPRKLGYLYKNVEENQFSYQMPNNLMGYTGSPDWQTHNSTFEEAGFNDAGVGISATETIYSNPQTLAIDPYVESTGIVEEAIPTILLPQIHSAREGVQKLGAIIESVGSGEGFGVAFVDSHEAWYLENAGGHHWLAVRVPNDKYLVSANQSRLNTVNLADSANYLASPKLIEFATHHGLYDAKRDGQFNFHKVYGQNNATDVGYNYPRVKALEGLFNPEVNNSLVQAGEFPLFVTPSKKLTVDDLAAGLSNYFVGTSSDPYTSQNPQATARPIAVFRTQQSHILQVRPQQVGALSRVEYLNLGMTALSVYVPFYHGALIPSAYQLGSESADNASAYWKFRKVETLAMLNFPKYAPWVQARYQQLNQQIRHNQQLFEREYAKLYPKNKVKAQQLLNNFTATTVNQAFDAADELVNRIITDKTREISQVYRFEGA
jgi:dipeptidase